MPPEPGGYGAEATVHASGLIRGEAGVVIRGEAGSGKSTLCLDLLDRAGLQGAHARLVGDDRLRLSRRHGRLIARPHPMLAGEIEIRGLGLRRLARHAPAMVVRLVVDLVETLPRLPEPSDDAELLGLRLPVLRLARTQPRARLVIEALRSLEHHPERWHPAFGKR